MAEYIKKVDVMKICQQYSQQCFYSNNVRGQFIVETIEDAVINIPTVDAVEVIRCKNCKKWNSTSRTCGEFIANEKLQGGGKAVFITEPDDFCSFGIRKEQRND